MHAANQRHSHSSRQKKRPNNTLTAIDYVQSIIDEVYWASLEAWKLFFGSVQTHQDYDRSIVDPSLSTPIEQFCIACNTTYCHKDTIIDGNNNNIRIARNFLLIRQTSYAFDQCL